MKRLSILLLIIGLIFVCSQSITAQETKQKKEAKVKVLINKDGKSIKFDTIIHDFRDHKEIMKIIRSKHLSDSLFEVIEGEDFMWISDDDSHGEHKVIIKELHGSDPSLHSKMSKHIRVISDNDENIIISDGDGEHKTIKIEIIDEDGNIHKKHSKVKKVYIIKEDIDLDISKDGDMKIIKIQCKSDHDEDIDIEVDISEDGKTTKKIKKRKAKKTEKKEK
ncbi:hypothetical protein DWB61_09690 [Ancylomarina euxinus]|uniref:Uncharacterized protein n=1 Tax=Ancylomarina euxinus TaxID=2283627 RepID=A0A425Y1D5_9BACT|nr:hypothetical protein [Ancylomarina euxinus]MCZ4693801.1 hypothetical protein [Ancylomarina euxinus]MUP15120.1 hypothetical protein [Ancylomarina euxinus]RRG21543.1 hypothetical protein DWB61_09690 [Ancylomarina euxinus]